MQDEKHTKSAHANAARHCNWPPLTLLLVLSATQGKSATYASPFVPNDEHFVRQWYLSGDDDDAHINVQGAWARGLTGAGVTVGVIDHGVQWDHPDLSKNYSAELSYDFENDDLDPYPELREGSIGAFFEAHGTLVAGIIAAEGGNDIGVTGIAPHTTLSSLRVNVSPYRSSSAMEATRHLSVAGNRRIDIKNHSYGYGEYHGSDSRHWSWEHFADVQPALTDSAAAGTIHVASAGNDRRDDVSRAQRSGDANKGLIASHPDVIAVSAINQSRSGRFASYSNFGANIYVTAPTGLYTTDTTGRSGGGARDYYPFSGTSASAPVVSAALALAKQANPALDSRMAKHLLALTSDSDIDVNDETFSSDGGWRTNAAGYRFNQNYGFGLLDVDALTLAAEEHVGVSPLQEEIYESGYLSDRSPIPDREHFWSDPQPLIHTFAMEQSGPLEEMLVSIDVFHENAHQLQATLTSPLGTSSRLMVAQDWQTVRDLEWTFKSNAFWGEEAAGEWTLELADIYVGDTGRLNRFSATARVGHLLPLPESTTVTIATWFVLLVTVGHSRPRTTRRSS